MERPLIVGAGPVGLGAALFLARRGRATRVAEKLSEPTTLSKALAVNPRTLDILEPTGITAKMLMMGKPIRGMQFHRDGRIVAAMSLDGIHPKYPFMLALSQATTEWLLDEALAAAGGTVERGIDLVECRNVAGGVDAVLQHPASGTREEVRAPWLLAADGARSTARHQLGVDFPGSTFAGEWYLADVALKTPLAADSAHVYFLPDSAFVFMIRVVNDARQEDPDKPVWRLVGNRPNLLAQLVDAEPIGPAIWESTFRVSHRIVSSFAAGRVYFAGDAAHIHSPMGARGMNLGLEDACVFAALADTNRLDKYDSLRRPIDRRVVQHVGFFSRLVSSDAWYFDFVRRHVFPHLLKTPLRDRIRATVTGLDHPSPGPVATDAVCAFL